MNQLSSNSSKSNLQQKIFFFFFCLLIVVNPFPLGSNRTWAWSLEAIVASVLLIVMVACSLISNQCISWHRIKKMKVELILIGIWLFVNFLYLIPLPISLVSLISPQVANAYSELGLSYGFLSLDVYASYQTLMLSVYYVTLFILGVVLINSRFRIKAVLILFVLLGIFESVYGMYLVSVGQTGTIVQLMTVDVVNASGTFINKNHLVAFLSMCFILGLALRMILARKIPNMTHLDFKIRLIRFISHPIRILDFSLFLMVAGIWNTHSRAGLASFLLALLFLSLFVFFSKKSKSVNYKKILSVFALGIVLLIIVAEDVNHLMNSLGQNTEDSLGHVISSAEGRLLAVNQVIDNYSTYWLTGVGPGAYPVFFVNHRMIEQTAFFDHAHNDYIEFLIEYGMFSIILLMMLAIYLYKIFMFIFKTSSKFYKYLGICVISSMIYMLLHGNMDFNARIPANIVTIIVAISMIYGRIVMSSINKTKK
ncbi:MAG: O-antigen ligase family protein [Marinicellaceae bacterium]